MDRDGRDDRSSALVSAAKHGDLTRVRELIAAGVPIDGEDESRETALSQAIRGERLEIARFLLAAGADTTQPVDSQHDISPLSLAVSFSSVAMVRVLLEGGARPNGPHRQRRRGSPIYFAALRGREEVVRLLLDYGVYVGSKGSFVRGAEDNATLPLQIAAERGHVEVVELLLANGARASQEAVTAAEETRRASAPHGHMRKRCNQILAMLRNAMA